MNTQDLLTYLFDALAFGYVALILLDLGSRLSGGLSDSFCSTAAQGVDAPATPVDLPSLHPADEGVLRKLTPLEVVAEERVLTMAVPLEVVADPWAAEEEPNLSQHPCCCHTAIATTPMPQLLLPPGLFGNADQPELAGLPNTELRKRCQSAGIRWRNVYGMNKHLSKSEMVTALSDRTTYCPR